MKILVTGGAGFIGSHLVEALVREGHDVRVLDNFFAGRRENLAAVRKDVDVLRGDCADPAAARRAVRGVEVVYHQAAVPSVARSVEDPELSHRSNATATLVMLDAARRAGVRRFLYAGSSSVYGDARVSPKREDLEPRPLSPYAAGKLMGEHYLRIFAELYGLEALTLRYFNVFGPRQDPGSPYSGVISLFITALLRGRSPVVYGDGRQTRDFTYVANVVDGNLRALRAAGLRGQVVNLATGRSVSLRQLLAALGRATGQRPRPRFAPARPGDIRHSLAEIRRARTLLGYRPRVDFETGLGWTVAWYREASARTSR
ncbi:MAG TPA: SDR family oxidoreductase [Vicinamibacteria bacterium]|nr:SDR family oxidoreductase [Vicinamibacteria bacterium]